MRTGAAFFCERAAAEELVVQSEWFGSVLPTFVAPEQPEKTITESKIRTLYQLKATSLGPRGAGGPGVLQTEAEA